MLLNFLSVRLFMIPWEYTILGSRKRDLAIATRKTRNGINDGDY